jgi:tetraacyldisaccharide 4'-kinase
MLKILLLPLSLIYGMILYIRNRLYDLNIFKSKEFDVTVISIGNITVGGTGKTPHVEYLIELLREKFKVATLSRGYKRKTKGYYEVAPESKVAEAGDEPIQLKRKFPEVSVSVCEDRVKGVEQLLADYGSSSPDVILLDDAFQHRRITPVINILLIDYNRPLKDDMLLPAGRLRESASQIRRANIIIFTKCPPEEVTPIKRRIIRSDVRLKPYQDMFFTTYDYGRIKNVFTGKELGNDFYKQHSYSILIVTGIAFPKLIPQFLKQFSSDTEIMHFPDHHYFNEADIRSIQTKLESLKNEKKIIITTEKDSVRLAESAALDEHFKKCLYFLPVKVKFLDDEGILFNKKILKYVGENKSNLELHRRKVSRQA